MKIKLGKVRIHVYYVLTCGLTVALFMNPTVNINSATRLLRNNMLWITRCLLTRP